MSQNKGSPTIHANWSEINKGHQTIVVTITFPTPIDDPTLPAALTQALIRYFKQKPVTGSRRVMYQGIPVNIGFGR